MAYRRNVAGQLLGEKYAGGPLNGLTVTNRYDQLLRRTNVATLNASLASLSSTAYSHHQPLCRAIASDRDDRDRSGFPILRAEIVLNIPCNLFRDLL